MSLLLVGASPRTLTECGLHSHNCYEVIMNTEGDGIAEIGGREYPFSSGTIHIVPPGMLHGKRSESGFRDLFFHTDALCSTKFAAAAAFLPKEPVLLTDDACRTMEKILLVLLERYLMNQEADDISKSLYDIILRLLEEWMSAASPEPVISQLIHIITASYSDPDFRITDALLSTGYSVDHIRRKFRQATGMTPNEYLTDVRIQYAKRLLRQKDKLHLPISEIAWMCGFYDSAYFCRLFRKTVGAAPSEYARS